MATAARKQSQSVIGLLRALNVDAARFRGSRPIYRRIVELHRARHRPRRAVAAGFRLPPERDLAARSVVSRATVVAAYRELEARGLVRGYVGRGTFVSATSDGERAVRLARQDFRDRDADDRLDAARSGAARRRPDRSFRSRPASRRWICFPTEAFRAAVDEVLSSHGTAAWGHAPTEGQPRFRDNARASLRRRTGQHPGDCRRAAGARSAGALPDRSRRRGHHRSPGIPGRAAEFPHPPARGLFGWDIARADIDELEDLLLRYRPKLIYTNPTFQNPTGVTLPIRARRELIELAKRYRVPIVEDDTYCELSLGAAAAAGAERARRGRHGRHPGEQLLEGAGAGTASRLDRRGAADHRPAGADEAAGRSAHAEPDPARGLAADRRRHVRSPPRDAARRASAPA